MDKLEVGCSGYSIASIGYGCAGLTRPATEQGRQDLLHTAFDAGIRHFDVARYYGYGQSEGVLGRFIEQTGCRDQITIATKFGMDPPAVGGSSRGRLLIKVARRVAAFHPSIRKILAARASASLSKNRFDVANAKLSLETSLRELRTDRIDLFLLHEATLADSQTEGLLEFLEGAKASGKILEFGLGSDFSLVPPIIERNPAVTQVVQISNGPGQWNRRKLPHNDERLVNTHGALKVLPKLEEARKIAGIELTRKWKGIGAPSGDTLAGLVLGLSLHDNPNGVTLFSSTQPDRIRRNVTEMLTSAGYSDADWVAFEEAAEALLAGTSSGKVSAD